MTLWVGIGDDDFVPANGESCGDMDGDGGFTNTAFFVNHGDDFHRFLSIIDTGVSTPKTDGNGFSEKSEKHDIHMITFSKLPVMWIYAISG